MSGAPVALVAVAEALRRERLLLTVRGAVEGVRVRGVSQDSRSVEPGDLFLAWRGTAHDAHEFVGDARDAGAVAAVVERELPAAELPQLVVADGRRAAAIAADRATGEPGRSLHLVGVTGTNGKTTTVALVRHLLQGGAAPAAAIGTLGLVEPSGAVRPGTEGLTTPGPVQTALWLRELADEGVGAVVLEASSHALEQRRLDAIPFDAAVFTNLSRDHLDYHEDREAYFRAKARLLGLVEPDGWAVVNAGQPEWGRLPVAALRRLRYGTGAEADLRAVNVELESGGSQFRMERGGRAVDVRLPLLGAFNVENALAAAGAALAAGRELDEIAAGLAEAPQIPGRLEVVVREPFTVIVDFAHTPDALARVLETVRPLATDRLTVVFGAGGDRDREKRPLMGGAVAGRADRIVVTSDNPRTEDPRRIVEDVAGGLDGVEHERIVDRKEAIEHVLGSARPDEVVLLAGKGHETYQVIGTEKRPFDERTIVREWLQAC